MLENIAKGTLEGPLYSYDSPYDPASPWSLAIAFLPETAPAKPALSFLNSAPLKNDGQVNEIDKDVASYVLEQCQINKWVAPAQFDQKSVERHFSQIRLRQIDLVGIPLEWPATDNVAEDLWYRGVLRVVALYRTYYSHELALADFEAQTPEDNVELLLRQTSASRVSRDIQYLILPYLRWANRPELLGKWLSTQRVAMAVPLARVPEATHAIIQVAYEQPIDARALKSIIDGLPRNPDTKDAIDKFARAVNTARLLGPLVTTLHQVDEWTNSDEKTQESILVQFSRNPPRDHTEDEVLRSTVFSKLSKETVDLQMMRGALEEARFMFVRKHLWDQKLLAKEVLEFISRKKSSGVLTETSLGSIIAALDLVTIPEGSTDQEFVSVKELCSYFASLNTVTTRYNIPLGSVLDREPLEVIQTILEYHTASYRQPGALVELAQQLGAKATRDKLGETIRERCIEAALADNNFSTAVGLARDTQGPEAWLSWLQIAKFLSPDWTDRPQSVLKEQRAAIRLALTKCPASDLPTVLTVWQELEQAETHVTPEASSQVSIQNSEAEPVRQRDQLKKLFVSGLGWAIGATPNDL